MTDIGELVVRIKADASELEREMRKMNGVVRQNANEVSDSLKDVKKQFAELLPVLTVGAVVEFGRRALEAADHINDLALRTGFAGSTLSALNIPLKQSGSNLDEFSASVNRMNNMIGEASKGTNQEAVKAFDALGLSVSKLKQLSPEDQFFAIAEALGKMDNQSQMTNAGMAIFGRSFASIIPLIKEAHGNLRDFTNQVKANGDALTDEQLKRIDEWGDRWTSAIEHAKLALVDYLDFFYKLGQEHRKLFDDYMGTKVMPSGAIISTERPDGAFGIKNWGTQFGPAMQTDLSGKGSNADLLRPKDSALKEYISTLKQETSAIGQNERALFIARAEIEATAKAKDDFNNHLRDSKELLGSEKASIDALAGSFYDLKKAQEENARIARKMKEELSDALADIAVNFKNLQTTATSAIQAIAKEIIKAKITNPLSSSIIDALPSFSFGKLLGFASGGTPPVGVPSIVGENGPEIFVPNALGTVIPNNKIGGTSVVVQQTIALNPSATEQTVAQLQNLVPAIMSATQASVMQAIQSGGSESRIVGRRS